MKLPVSTWEGTGEAGRTHDLRSRLVGWVRPYEDVAGMQVGMELRSIVVNWKNIQSGQEKMYPTPLEHHRGEQRGSDFHNLSRGESILGKSNLVRESAGIDIASEGLISMWNNGGI